jgi:hypothetical protein
MFYIYLDPWNSKLSPYFSTLGGTPYTYFSTQGINNQYLSTSGYGATAYFFGSKQFYNPNTYQIISAGKDGNFGNGNMIGGIATGYPGGADDQANFSSTLLSLGQN